ncbi:MAG TPA: VOC family protein [Candidatus Acidoferrales bacterium]|nr:VOC family protein [Candidatus Acidoferrales bacterium]
MSTTAAATTTTTPITGIDITVYFIKEPDRAVAFWRDTMGLKLTQRYGENGGEFELPDGSTFGLWKLEDAPWQKSGGIMFAVPDINAAVAYYRAKGVQISPVEEQQICSMAFAQDSEGNDFILHQRKT